MSVLWPRLSDIRYSDRLLSRASFELLLLSDGAYRAFMMLVAQYAAGHVWTYTEPTDKSLPDDERVLARLVGIGIRRWRKVRPELESLFVIRQGWWHPKDEWFSIDDRGLRGVVPQRVLDLVMAREGRRCTYCGSADGPFDYDHILPVSRGGTNDPSNLTLACATCNRSKGARTLREWMGHE